MKIAVLGRTGQVATEFIRRAPKDVEVLPIGRDQADFENPESVVAAIKGTECDAVVNSVGYTAVDRAEMEPGVAEIVNHTSVKYLANALNELGRPLIHISTDYVFDGSGDKPKKPGDIAAPLSVYGRTKLSGEEAIRSSGVQHIILRASWVFSPHGDNFVKSMLRLGQAQSSVRVVNDQIGGPTSARSIADALFVAGRALHSGDAGGTYHFSGAPDVSWADFAREIFRQADIDCQVEDTPSAAYKTHAVRPMNSRLDCGSLERSLGVTRPDWRDELAAVLKELS